MREITASVESEFLKYKKLGEGAIQQVDDAELIRVAPGFDNSIAVLVWHISGNLKSRFSDFLTTDGEKPWRGRDEEFALRAVGRQAVVEKWEEGWGILQSELAQLSDADLQKTITIREQPMKVYDALHRALAHVSYHVGQIVFMAKSAKGAGWTFLSIPPGKSEEVNAKLRKSATGDATRSGDRG